MCKLNVYDWDVRIPFAARGPDIIPGTQVNAIASNVDIVRAGRGKEKNGQLHNQFFFGYCQALYLCFFYRFLSLSFSL